jgi:3'-phosphoadenosine 5'-phosphosulfate sulfotransferase (PAPS reductase)/FAD synthetase
MRKLSLTPEIIDLVDAGAVIAFGISGGKDSSTMVLEVTKWLDERGHPEDKRVCYHADLGIIDWPQTPEYVRMQANLAGAPLRIVRRTRGDMVEKWEQRWAANVERYETLRCVKIISPWSSAQWRFCTSELKVAPIVSDLKREFPGEKILNLTGIRKEESSGRAKAPTIKEMPKLRVKTKGTQGWQWNPILDYSFDDVMAVHKETGTKLHPAYTEYGSARLSCAYCILATNGDHLAALACEGNHPSYNKLIDLEIRSSFSFKPKDWLCERDPTFLGPFSYEIIEGAKMKAATRREVELQISTEMQYVAGWPVRPPTQEEAETLAKVRQGMNMLLQDLNCQYLEPSEIIKRYEELMDIKESKK